MDNEINMTAESNGSPTSMTSDTSRIPINRNNTMYTQSSQDGIMVEADSSKSGKGCMVCVRETILESYDHLKAGDHIQKEGSCGSLYYHHAIVKEVKEVSSDNKTAIVKVIDIPNAGGCKGELAIEEHDLTINNTNRIKCTKLKRVDYRKRRYDHLTTVNRAQLYMKAMSTGIQVRSVGVQMGPPLVQASSPDEQVLSDGGQVSSLDIQGSLPAIQASPLDEQVLSDGAQVSSLDIQGSSPAVQASPLDEQVLSDGIPASEPDVQVRSVGVQTGPPVVQASSPDEQELSDGGQVSSLDIQGRSPDVQDGCGIPCCGRCTDNNKYCLFINNCEHFATTCVNGTDKISSKHINQTLCSQACAYGWLLLHFIICALQAGLYTVNFYIYASLVANDGAYTIHSSNFMAGMISWACYYPNNHYYAMDTRCDWYTLGIFDFLLISIFFIVISEQMYPYFKDGMVCKQCLITAGIKMGFIVLILTFFSILNIFFENVLHTIVSRLETQWPLTIFIICVMSLVEVMLTLLSSHKFTRFTLWALGRCCCKGCCCCEIEDDTCTVAHLDILV